jgi:hypothetical protein
MGDVMNANRSPDRHQFQRLPLAPRTPFETGIHLALGLATLAAVWQFQAAILHFVPRAATFAERVRETPAAIVDGGLALRAPVTNAPGQASMRPGTNAPTRPIRLPVPAGDTGSAS